VTTEGTVKSFMKPLGESGQLLERFLIDRPAHTKEEIACVRRGLGAIGGFAPEPRDLIYRFGARIWSQRGGTRNACFSRRLNELAAQKARIFDSTP
jgi:hypothetical protein